MAQLGVTQPYIGGLALRGMIGAGTRAMNILRLAANVADTETLTIGTEVYEINSTGGITAGRIAVDCSGGVTPALATTAIALAINTNTALPITALKISDNEMAIYGDDAYPYTYACTETLAGSNNVWAAAAMFGGSEQTQLKQVMFSRVPTATEVALGTMHFFLDFTPLYVETEVRTTSSGVKVAWGGATSIDAANKKITLTNGTDPDWSANETVTLAVAGLL